MIVLYLYGGNSHYSESESSKEDYAEKERIWQADLEKLAREERQE